MEKLTKNEQSTLKFLRRLVDEAEAQAHGLDAHRDVLADLHRARKELKKYVEELRRKGRVI